MLNAKLVNQLNELFADELKVTADLRKNERYSSWECPIGTLQIDDFCILPLTTARKIKSEGYMMQNCVCDYISRCMQGEYLLFSIRNVTGKRVATLGVQKITDRWIFDDCLGKKNSPLIETIIESVDGYGNFSFEYTKLYYVGHEVVRLLNFKQNNEVAWVE